MALSRLAQLRPVLQQCVFQPSGNTSPHPIQTDDNIQVTPRVSLIDQKVHIRVHGLPTKAKVTLCVQTLQEWRRKLVVYKSCGHFVTSDQGDLDLDRDAAVGGTYTGLDPMGPFWSMTPCPSGPQNVRLVVRNGEDPVLYTLSLYLGHWSLTDLVARETTLTPVYSTTVTRLKKAADAWESGAHLLMLISDDDQQVEPTDADTFRRAYPRDRRHLVEVVHYPGAGHLLEPPYTPHCLSCFNPVFDGDLLWGGNPVDHAVAQEDSWQRIIAFLQTHLS